MSERPYSARQVAELLGVSLDTFHRNYARYVAAGMPAALAPFGHKKFDRASIEAWRGRNHPLAPRRPANDDAALPPPVADPAWRERLKTVYGGG